MFRRAACAVLVAVSVMTTPMYATRLTASRTAGTAVLGEISRRDPALAQQIHSAYWSEQPVFIFVPGVLGSKLVAADGTLLWGAINFRSSDLRYPSQVQPDFLDNFAVFGYPTDVYGRFRDIVQGMDVSDIPHLLTFPYDWRADLRTTAEAFDARLRVQWGSAIKGRHVVIVAHSMGGLVIDWWYKKIYSAAQPGAYGFSDIKKIVFLGTPHRGATSALLSIITGYQPPNPGAFEKAVYSKVFRDLNDAAGTFPSLYQMFPLDDDIVTEDTSTGLSHVDHFSLAAWQRYRWGGGPANLNDPFYITLKRHLDDGKAFQMAIQAKPCIPNAVYFYSKEYNTATTIVMRRKGNGFVAEPLYPEHAGDSRVTILSAQNEPCLTDAVQVRPDREEHGALANDSAFIDFLVTIRDLSMRNADARVVSLVKDRADVIDLMASKGALLPVPLNRDARNSSDARMILAFDRRILQRAAGMTPNDGVSLVYRAAKAAYSDESDAAPGLYAIALGLDESSPLAYHAANNLGLALLEEGAPNAAKTNLVLTVAREPLSRGTDGKALRAASFNNLAVAYYRTGEKEKARNSWERAAKLDPDSPAREHLRRLKTVSPE